MKKYSEIQTDDILVLESNKIVPKMAVEFPQDYFWDCSDEPIESVKVLSEHIKSIWRFIDGKPKRVWLREEDLNEAEKAVIALAKSYGCKYIVMGSAGEIRGFHKKPCKETPYYTRGYWRCKEDIGNEYLMTGEQAGKSHISFISWEDEEPYEIIY